MQGSPTKNPLFVFGVGRKDTVPTSAEKVAQRLFETYYKTPPQDEVSIKWIQYESRVSGVAAAFGAHAKVASTVLGMIVEGLIPAYAKIMVLEEDAVLLEEYDKRTHRAIFVENAEEDEDEKTARSVIPELDHVMFGSNPPSRLIQQVNSVDLPSLIRPYHVARFHHYAVNVASLACSVYSVARFCELYSKILTTYLTSITTGQNIRPVDDYLTVVDVAIANRLTRNSVHNLRHIYIGRNLVVQQPGYSYVAGKEVDNTRDIMLPNIVPVIKQAREVYYGTKRV